MNVLMVRNLVRDLVTYHLLYCFVIFLVADVNGVLVRGDLKTKLLLKNIRTHLAQKVDEVVQQKECESGLTLCKPVLNKEIEGDEEKSEEVPPPPKIVRGHHKPFIKVNPKDAIQTMMPKVHRNFVRRHQKKEIQEKFTKSYRKEEEEEEEEADSESKSKESVEEREESFIEKRKAFPKFQKLNLKPLSPSPGSKEKVVKVSDVKTGKTIIEEIKKKPKTEKDEVYRKRDTVDKKTQKDVAQKDSKKDLKKYRQAEEGKKRMKEEKKEKVHAKEAVTKRDDIFSIKTFIFSVDSDEKEDNLCAKHSNIYLKQLKKYKIWALMMFDASAKFPSGLLQGNANQLGDFDECLSINAVFKKPKRKNDFPAIKGKYCLANIDVTSNLEENSFKQALERVESFSFIRSTIDDPGHFIPRFTSINWGLCVPAICPAKNVKQFIDSKLEVYNDTNGLIFNVNVEEDNCVAKKDVKFQFEMSTILVLLFYLIVIVIAIYGTFRDLNQTTKEQDKSFNEKSGSESLLKDLSKSEDFQQIGKMERFIMAFSLKRNFKILFSESENKDSIECINGIKALFTIMLYFAHKIIPLGWTPFSNRIFLTKMSNESSTVILRVSHIYTDGFLLISGLLTAYSLSIEIAKKGKISWAQKILARIIRLTPALIAVLLFYAYVWDHLGSGPLWNLVCAPQTHHLAMDMQLSVLAPFFVYLIYEYDKVGIGIIQALFLVSSILRYIITWNNELSVVIYHGMSVSQLYKTANLLYGQTLSRASPYLMGVIVGYHLPKFKAQFEFPKSVAFLGWIIAFSFALYSIVFPSHMASREYQYSVNEAAQYAALSPVSWSLALSYLISACYLGFGGKLNEFLCHKSFLVFSRISYSLYLTQFLVFFYKIGVKRIPETFTFTGSFDVTEFFLVIIVSVIVTLLFDIPMIEVKKIIFDIFFVNNPKIEGEELPLSVYDAQLENDNISGEYLTDNQENLSYINEEEEEVIDDFQNDDEGGNEEEGEDEDEEDDSQRDENEEEDEEISMQPLRRSVTINFDNESDDRDWLKIDEENSE